MRIGKGSPLQHALVHWSCKWEAFFESQLRYERPPWVNTETRLGWADLSFVRGGVARVRRFGFSIKNWKLVSLNPAHPKFLETFCLPTSVTQIFIVLSWLFSLTMGLCWRSTKLGSCDSLYSLWAQLSDQYPCWGESFKMGLLLTRNQSYSIIH